MPVDEHDLATLRTPAQAAEFLKVSTRTLRRLIHDGDLLPVRIGSGRGRPMFTERALLDYANRRADRPAPVDGKARGTR